MILVKTPAGMQALKDRHGSLSPRQRSAFILFDGKRSIDDVLAATALMGITRDAVQAMIDQGLLELAGAAAAVAVEAPAAAPAAAEETASSRSLMERYQEAYPIATELTASMGLRGFRLNLAVEAATGYEELAALAPKIREAVGDAKYARLKRALFA